MEGLFIGTAGSQNTILVYVNSQLIACGFCCVERGLQFSLGQQSRENYLIPSPPEFCKIDITPVRDGQGFGNDSVGLCLYRCLIVGPLFRPNIMVYRDQKAWEVSVRVPQRHWRSEGFWEGTLVIESQYKSIDQEKTKGTSPEL